MAVYQETELIYVKSITKIYQYYCGYRKGVLEPGLDFTANEIWTLQ